MKINFVLWTTSLSGGARAIFEIANRLSERGYDVMIISLGGDHSWFKVKVPVYYVEVPRPLGPIIKAYKALRCICFRGIKANYFDVNRMARRLGLGFQVDLIRILAEASSSFEPDIAIATWYPTALSVWLSCTDRPFYFVQDFPELVQEVDGIYGLRLFESTLRLPFYFLANSTFTRSLILNHNKDAKVTVTGVGVDITTFYPRNVRAVDSQGKPIVMAIIRGIKFKGDEVALKALNMINKELPIHVILVGSSITINKLFNEVKPEFTYSLFEGVDDNDLAKLYSSSDIFIFTSYQESFGLPPLEAMACGTAVVTTNCGGNMDYTMNDYNALVVPPGDPKVVAEAALKILKNDDLREKLIEGGINTARQWTWDKVVNKFEEAIKGDN
jgi:glycosyltransferase involved in cell wall biosynthesis